MIQEHLKCLLFWSNIFQKFTWFSYKIETEQDFPYQQPTNNIYVNYFPARQESRVTLNTIIENGGNRNGNW